MAPNRFRRDVREKTPFADEGGGGGGSVDEAAVVAAATAAAAAAAAAGPSSSTLTSVSTMSGPVPEIPPEWRDFEAPINFTWVCQDELAGMGWPKSRDQVRY